jgi:hypothetical protein
VSTKDNVLFPMFKHHKTEALTKAIIDAVYENGEGVSVAEIIGALAFCKIHFIEEALSRVEGENDYE